MTSSNAPYSHFRLDSQWTIVDVDTAFERMTALSSQDVVGQQLDGLVSRRDRKGVVELDKQRSTYQTGLIDVILQLKGGNGDVLARVRVAKSDEGWDAWLENLLCEGNDTLQRLNAETEWCRNVVSRSDEGIVVLTPDNAVAEINQSAMDLLAFRSADGVLLSHEVVSGSGFFDRLPTESFEPFVEAAKRAAKKKKLRVVEDIEHEGKELRVRLTALHLPVRGHVGCTLSIRDITAQRQIERMSEQLRVKNEDIRVILSNLDLGILTIENGGTVHPEFSDRLPGLLGKDDVAGRDVTALLFENSDVGADDLARVRTALDLTLGDSVFGFELNRNCFPTSFAVMTGGQRRELEADWAPIESDDGTVHRILVVLRDVTELNQLRSAAEAQQRELTMIGELLATPADAFEEYGRACHAGLAETLAFAGGEAVDPVGLARTVHTLKGNARAWGLKAICDSIHHLEEVLLAEERDDNELAERARRTEAVLGAYESLAKDKLNRGGNQETASDHEQQLLREVFDVVSTRPESLPPDVRRLATAAAFLPALPRLNAIAAKLGTHAEREGKGKPRFFFPATMLVHRQRLDQLHGAFVHLLTNAVDHGLEPNAERIQGGKDPRGTIRMSADQVEGALQLTLEDDGRGLALARLRAKANCDILTPEEAERLVFDPGLSTADRVTQSSGRGMGMSAVRSELADLGATIGLRFNDFDPAAEFVPFRFVISLPLSFARLDTVDALSDWAA